MAHLRSHVQLETNHPGSAMGSYEWLYMVMWPWPSSKHDCQFPVEPHDWSWVLVASKIVAGGWSRSWKSLWLFHHQLHNLPFRGIIRGNENILIIPSQVNIGSGLLLQGFCVSPSYWKCLFLSPHPSHQPSATHTCCVLSSSTWQVMAPVDPWAILLLQGSNAPSLASNSAGENVTPISGHPGYTEASAFLSFLQGWCYKPFG